MSDTVRLLDDTAERLLARRLSDPFARANAALRAMLFADIAEAGLPLVLVTEDRGGLGGGLTEAAAVAWRMGWHAAPVPVTPLLLLPALPGGEDWAEGRTTLAEPSGLALAGGRLTGRRIEAPALGETGTILVPCEGDDGPALAEVDAAGASRFHALAGELWLAVEAAEASVGAVHRSPVDSERLAMQGALLTAAAMAGATARVLEIVVEHAGTRRQFGKALGAFQAVQHLIAVAASEQAVAQAALSGAVAAEDAGAGRPILCRSAKAQAGRAATIVTAAAHQVLGAIGFTEEHALHHYSKRLWVWRDDWGRQSALEAAIGEAACADPRGLWSHLVDDAA